MRDAWIPQTPKLVQTIPLEPSQGGKGKKSQPRRPRKKSKGAREKNYTKKRREERKSYFFSILFFVEVFPRVGHWVRTKNRKVQNGRRVTILSQDKQIVYSRSMMCTIVVLRFWYIFFLIWQTKTVSSSLFDCPALLKNFAEAVSNFTFCAVSNSRPFRFCCRCKDVYVETLNGHKAIVEKKECHNDLIMAEKYQLVEYSYAFVVDMWESANCPGKFKPNVGWPGVGRAFEPN